MMAERSTVQFGTAVIPFEVRRSANRSQVSLVIQAGQRGVMIYAPEDAPLDRLAAVVRQRGAWAVAKLRQVEVTERPGQPKEFVSGEGFAYLGRSFRLAIHVARGPQRARMDRGWLVVKVPADVGERARRSAVRATVVTWFRERAAARLPERLERFTRKLGLPAPRLLLRDQARRWGSCNEKGEVRLNWRIVQAPMVLVDYVAAHEAVHLVHKDHTRAYWAELARLVPDVERCRAELRRRGAGYLW
jgi:predicted metal-dependent hydrolase